MENNKNHNLQLEYGQGLLATAVQDVLSFNEKEVKISLCSGKKLVAIGEKLKISGFNKQSGELKITGEVSLIKYLSSPTSQLRKLFK